MNMKQKKGMAFLLLFMMLFTLAFPANLRVTAAQKNAITELGIKKLPENSTMEVGETYNFDPKILKTERGRGKTTGVVWWEVNSKTNTAGVASSRWGIVSPICAGSFEIRALAFANKEQMNMWRKNHIDGEQYITASTDWITISVTSKSEGYALVHTQKQLNRALSKRSCTDIHIMTDEETTFMIAAHNYRNKTLTINAPNADVINEARFNQIKIEQIKESTFFERAKGNLFHITAPNASLCIEKNARVREISFESDKNVAEEELPKLHIINAGGNIANIRIVSKGTIILSGEPSMSIPVVVEETASGARVEVGVKAVLDLKADAVIKMAKEASKTIINLIVPKVKVDILGETTQDTRVNIAEEAMDAEVSTKVSVEIFVRADADIEIGKGAEESVIYKDEGITLETSNKTDVEIITSDLTGNNISMVKPGENKTETTTPVPVPTGNPDSGSNDGSFIPMPVPTTNPNLVPTATITPVPTAPPNPTNIPTPDSRRFYYTVEGIGEYFSNYDVNYNITIQLSKNEIGKKLQFIGSDLENREKYQISPETIIIEDGIHPIDVTITTKDNPENKVIYKVTIAVQEIPAFKGSVFYQIEGEELSYRMENDSTVPLMKNDIGKKIIIWANGNYNIQNYTLITDPQDLTIQDGETKVNITITARDNPENKVVYTVTFIVKPVPIFDETLIYWMEGADYGMGIRSDGIIQLSSNEIGKKIRFQTKRFYQINPETITIEEGTHQVDITITAKDNPENKVIYTIVITAKEVPVYDGGIFYTVDGGSSDAIAFEGNIGTISLVERDIGKKIEIFPLDGSYDLQNYTLTTDPQELVVQDGETKVTVTVTAKDNPENKVVYTIIFSIEPIPVFDGYFGYKIPNSDLVYNTTAHNVDIQCSKNEIGQEIQFVINILDNKEELYQISPETVIIEEGIHKMDVTVAAKDNPENKVIYQVTITAKEIPAFEGSLAYRAEGEKVWSRINCEGNRGTVTLMESELGKKIEFNITSDSYDSRHYMLTTDPQELVIQDGETEITVTVTAKDNPENKIVYTITFIASNPSQNLPLPNVSINTDNSDIVTTLQNGVIVISGSAIDVMLTAKLSEESVSNWNIISYTWYQAESADAEGTVIDGQTGATCQVNVEENKKMYYYVKVRIKRSDNPDAEEKEIMSKTDTNSSSILYKLTL